MRGKLFSKGAVVALVGGVAMALGIFLAIAFLRAPPDGSTIIQVPEAGVVGALALLFMVAGAGVWCRVRLATELLALTFAGLGCCQVLAAAEAESWVAGLQHTLFAQWLCGGAFVLWVHRKSAPEPRRNV